MPQTSLPLVELFGTPECHLCEAAKVLLRALQTRYPFTLRIIDIAEQEALLAQYGEEIPVICINGHKAFKYRIDPRQFVRRLQRAQGSSEPTLWQRVWRR